MAQDTDPCDPCHWVMGCPVWTLTVTSHNRVVCKICPNTDVACTSGVLHLVGPLSQSLSSMVEPTRSLNSSWHSLWSLQGTHAPQLRQSNNTLEGMQWIAPLLVHKNKYLFGVKCISSCWTCCLWSPTSKSQFSTSRSPSEMPWKICCQRFAFFAALSTGDKPCGVR